MDFFLLVEQHVRHAFEAQPALWQHLQRTEFWLRQFNPQADMAFRSAALAHDIERSEIENDHNRRMRHAGFKDAQALKYHQQRGAQIITKLLNEYRVAPAQIERVANLIAHHEIGGTEEQNLLKDVDSLSFLENNLDYFTQNLVPRHGVVAVKEKFEWMYHRIGNTHIAERAQPYYQHAMRALTALQNKV